MRNPEDEQYGLDNGFSPEAKGVICVDWDGTIVPWGPLFPECPKVEPGAVEALKALKAAGYQIYIFTSRLSPTWLASSGTSAEDHIRWITVACESWGIPFDGITAEKIPAIAYIDDRAITYPQISPLRKKTAWDVIAERVVARG